MIALQAGAAVRRGRIGVLQTADATAITDSEKAEMFADSLYKIADSTLAMNDYEHFSILQEMSFNTFRKGTEIDPATVSEVQGHINALKSKKAPGLDNINNVTMKHLPNNIVKFFTDIINVIISTQTFPQIWKKAKIILILKPGKPRSDPDSYRPISLLSTLGKITERIILTRLQEQCSELNVIPDEQFGFRESHGTELQLLRLTEQIHQALDARDTVSGAFLEIKRAFDTVWQNGLIAKLYKLNFNPSIVRLIQSYITDRSFVVSVENSLSSPRALRAGLAQGSVLSPVLYTIYTADFPSSEAVSLYSYADDTALVTSCREPKIAHRRLQNALDVACQYFRTWKLSPDPDKSQYIVFTTRINLPQLPLTLNGQIIPRCNSVKYLGLHYDTKLIWRNHIFQTAKKGSQALGFLYPKSVVQVTFPFLTKSLFTNKSFVPSLLTAVSFGVQQPQATSKNCKSFKINLVVSLSTLRQIQT